MEEDESKITIEELRSNKGYENITEEDANIIIEELYQLSLIAYHIINK